jgi:hypothetical protein
MAEMPNGWEECARNGTMTAEDREAYRAMWVPVRDVPPGILCPERAWKPTEMRKVRMVRAWKRTERNCDNEC